MDHEIFYLVWCPNTGYTMCRHAFKRPAELEAERLAREHKGKEFHVLASLGSVRSNDLIWTKPKEDDIPF